MRKLTLFLVSIVLSTISFSQILKDDVLDLNPGGVVHDVIYDEINDDYIVAGDFTSINGVARQNLAIIDAATFAVSPTNPISSINGAIRTLALKQTPASFPNDGLSRLFLGGEFTTVNGNTRNYIFQMRKVEPLIGPFNTNYLINTLWNGQITNVFDPQDQVNDFAWRGDSLVALGQYTVLGSNTNYTSDDFGGILCFNGSQNTMIYHEFMLTFSQTYLSDEHFEGQFYNNEFYLSGEQGFDRFTAAGTYITTFPICSNGYPYTSRVHETETDTLIIGRAQYGGGEGIIVNELDGNMLNCPFGNQILPILMNGGSPANGFIETYENFVFVAESDEILSYNRIGTPQVQPQLVTPMNNNWYSYITNTHRPKKMKVAKDKLFVFADNLTTIAGQSRTGFAVMCLPPNNSESFTSSDTQVCEEEITTYTIPAVEYTEGYRWEYSGTGAQYRIAGTTFPFQALTDNHISATNANSIEIYFPSGTTNGTVTVSPYNTCNSAIDYQYGTSQTVNVSIVGLPDISMADTLFLNCYSDSGWIEVNSVTAGVSYQIQSSFGTVNNDSLYRDTTITGLIEEFYFGTVLEPVNGCMSNDSTWLDMNFAIPTVPNNDIFLSPTEMNCSVDSLEVNIVTPGLNIFWEYDNDPLIPLPNPFYIYSDDSLNFTAYFTDLQNGCENTLNNFVVPNNQSQASGEIIGYPTITLPLDTISCNNPTLNLTCAAIDGTATWTSSGTDNLSLTSIDSAGMTNNTQIYAFETIHNLSGCPQLFNAVIYFDLDTPFVAPFTGNPSINCSDSFAEVVHPIAGNPTEGWLDQFGVQTGNDTLIATAIGEYYYQVQGTNGCLATDTVSVNQTLDMTVNLIADTLICPGEPVSIVATPIINTGETPTYLWSTGSTTNSGTAIGGTNSELSIIVQTNSGCIGYDTTEILITAPIDAYFSSSTGCSAGAIQVDSIFGGNGGYEYSLDQLNWQTTPAFTGVAVGTNDIYVRDNLGCIYSFQETIDPAAGGPDVNFLVPTYSDLGDTTVAVNYGSFNGFDSLNWVLPASADIVFEADSMVAFSIGTEGWYDVTLIGYSDTCQYSATKQVYFGASAQFDSITNSLGVQSILIYPNPTPNGLFTIDVELGVAQNYSIQIVSATGQPIQNMSVSGISQFISESFQFPQGTVPGSYIIHLICDYDIEQETIILN